MSKLLIPRAPVRALASVLAVALLLPADDIVKKKPLPGVAGPDMTAFWNQPQDIATRDLYYGIGGKAHEPHAPFTFLKEDMSGSNPKFSVRDSAGVKWKVKLGSEARGETAAARFVWAAGYYADEDYALTDFQVQSMPALHRGQKYVGPDGMMHNVRLKRDSKDDKKSGGIWKWRENPFVDTREWNGLRVVMALLDNWDLKDVNNAIREIDGKQVYLVSDLGASFGGIHSGSPKGDAEAYAKSRFITEVSGDTVSFSAPGRPPLIHAFSPFGFASRVHMQGLGDRIPVADARWMAQLLGQLSDEQVQSAFRAAGYDPDSVQLFAATIRTRIAELSRL